MNEADFLCCSLSKSDFEEAYGLLCVEDTENVDELRDTEEIEWHGDHFIDQVKTAQRRHLESADNRERELYIKIRGLPADETFYFLIRLLRVLKDYQCECTPSRCPTRFVVAANERQRMQLVMRATQPANDRCCVTPMQWGAFMEILNKQAEMNWH